MLRGFDLLVLGGGIIGAAVALGAARTGAKVGMIDAGDDAFRASVGNFGLLWTQGKGGAASAYADWTRKSARLWPDFATRLQAESDVDFDFRQEGGLRFVMTEKEAATHREKLAAPGEGREFEQEFIPPDLLRQWLPAIGPAVHGATFCRRDGAVNPLLLLRALRRAGERAGVAMFQGRPARDLARVDGVFSAFVGDDRFQADRVMLAAGLANRALAKNLGADIALFPQRGQLMVTERCAPFIPVLTGSVRQTREGTVMIGVTQENAGFDKSVDVPSLSAMAQRAISVFPRIAQLRLVRSWGCLRVMTPDGEPIYEELEGNPGAFVATAHSGVTLAAVHALELAPAVLAGRLPAELSAFRADRFPPDWQSHAGGAAH